MGGFALVRLFALKIQENPKDVYSEVGSSVVNMAYFQERVIGIGALTLLFVQLWAKQCLSVLSCLFFTKKNVFSFCGAQAVCEVWLFQFQSSLRYKEDRAVRLTAQSCPLQPTACSAIHGNWKRHCIL